MEKSTIWLLIPFFIITAYSQKPTTVLADTYSIIAIDTVTGQLGAAVQSHWFSVGSIVLWGRGGTGVVATQSFVNVSYGVKALDLLDLGYSPEEVIAILTEHDKGAPFRQAAVLDKHGNVAAFTGDKCIQYAGHITGDGYSVQANMMLNDKVVPAMSEAFENSSGPLAERLLKALEAAQNAGGDIRGKQSAALLVVSGTGTGKPWNDVLIDLRVDDSKEPLKELSRLLKLYRAYEHMNEGDLAVEENDIDKALEEYSAAENMFPDNLEMKYWKAVSLANSGMMEEALPIFREIFSVDDNWRLLTERISENGILQVSEKNLEMILNAGSEK